MTDRATAWSVTINNPTEQDEECIALARQKRWRVIGQKERGEGGTEHYQLMLKTPQVRFAAIKKTFPRGHIEIARDPVALEKYVQKEDTRVGDLTKNDQLYPSMSKVWNLLAVYVDEGRGRCGEFRNWNADMWLTVWDAFIGKCIIDGLYVEHVGANPQNRSIVKLYGQEIVTRELNRNALNSVEENLELESYHAAQDEEVNAQAPPSVPS